MTNDEFFEQDYSYLEGMEVYFKCSEYQERCIVAGCDPNIGLTLVMARCKSQPVFCMRGPSAPTFNNHDKAVEEHIAGFNAAVKMIEEGHTFDDAIVCKARSAVTGVSNDIFSSNPACPFMA